MAYAFDLKKISLEDFKGILQEGYLIPSQVVLREDIDEYFRILEEDDVKNMLDLSKLIKSKKKAEDYSVQSEIPLDYLIVLRRAVSSYLPKPRKLEDYSDIDKIQLEMFKAKGCKTSKDLYESDLVYNDRIVALMDVSRLRYVSGTFATALVKSGYVSIASISQANPDQMYKDMVETNNEHHIYKGPIGRNDMVFIIEDAKLWIKYKMI